MNYRKIWETTHGPIPIDENGVTFDIHHIDGNRKNNTIENLQCVSLIEHYEIHLSKFLIDFNPKDFAAIVFLSNRINKTAKGITGHTVSLETRIKISESLQGRKRPEHVGIAVSNALKGRVQSEENIEKRRQGLIEFHKNLDSDKKREWYSKISESMTGKKQPEEIKLKLAKLNSKLTDEEVLEIDSLIKNSVKYKEISNRFKISLAQISAIKQRKTYKWVFDEV